MIFSMSWARSWASAVPGLREKNISLDEKAALMAEHIRLEFGAVAGDEG